MIDEALRAAHESTKGRSNWSLSEFLDMTAGWDVHPVLLGGVVVGAVLIKGPEIHACINSKAHGLWMNKRILALLDCVVERHGMAVTRVMSASKAGVDFVTRLGFKLESEQNGVMVWVLKR